MAFGFRFGVLARVPGELPVRQQFPDLRGYRFTLIMDFASICWFLLQ
jgi:hypothetical protein